MKDEKVQFGLNQIGQKTPIWAKWLFRLTLLLTTAISTWIGLTNLISPESKYEIVIILKAIDPLILIISKMFGVNQEKKN